jgi:hypothetical protein
MKFKYVLYIDTTQLDNPPIEGKNISWNKYKNA